MNARQLRVEIDSVERQLKDLESARERSLALRRKLLIQGDAQAVAALDHGFGGDGMVLQALASVGGDRLCRTGVRAMEQRIVLLRERRDLLHGELPSPAQVAQAEREAAELVAEADAGREEYERAWRHFVRALVTAEPLARVLVTARAQALEPVQRLQALRDGYALDVAGPGAFEPRPAEAKAAGVLGRLLSDAVYYQEIDGRLAAEVAEALRQLTRGAGSDDALDVPGPVLTSTEISGV